MMLPPEDILLHVFSYFQRSSPVEDSSEVNEDSIRQATLAALSRSCRLFHVLVNPLLFGTIDLRRHTSRRLRPLIKTLAGNSELAGLIRIINTEVLDSPPRSRSGDRDELTNAPHNDYQEPLKENPSPLTLTIQSLSLPRWLEHSIITGATANSDNALMALLLGLCYNLETFQFRARPGIERSATMQLISSATTTSPQSPPSRNLLTSLRHVIIWHQPYSSDPVPFPALSPFLYLPSIRTFEGDLLSCTSRTIIPYATRETAPAHPSPLQTLTLTNTFLDGTGLDSLLKTCPSLQALSVHFADLCCEELCSLAAATADEEGVNFTRFARLGEVLRRRRPATLRKLALELDGNHFLDSRAEGGDEGVVPGIGDLRCLEGLEELTLPGMALCGIRPRSESEDGRDGILDVNGTGDRLPRGLRKLDVILDEDRNEDDEEALDGALARLGRTWLGGRLESICIDGVEIWPDS
ncbi:hypothetical protein KC318_g6738 [Hortaea werneckii]|nr:hypothetical protein KC334_g7050 [Hortaea werneckii]KAI7010569.1 hypothetical protein KC355_g6122 [Hortaea werneckii]KAI7186738.1 hypothetical protein KC324_g7073 [Hortaea werneckii]KAI7589961.1 hypothetical protein KC316_g3642 [Hortaea werneckii]KAI7666061.1 hypothetical protein KC318_g6738 [Hortaea werneckii]